MSDEEEIKKSLKELGNVEEGLIVDTDILTNNAGHFNKF